LARVIRVEEERSLVELEWNGITITFEVFDDSDGQLNARIVGRGKIFSTRSNPGDTDIPKTAFWKMRRQALAIIGSRRKRTQGKLF